MKTCRVVAISAIAVIILGISLYFGIRHSRRKRINTTSTSKPTRFTGSNVKHSSVLYLGLQQPSIGSEYLSYEHSDVPGLPGYKKNTLSSSKKLEIDEASFLTYNLQIEGGIFSRATIYTWFDDPVLIIINTTQMVNDKEVNRFNYFAATNDMMNLYSKYPMDSDIQDNLVEIQKLLKKINRNRKHLFTLDIHDDLGDPTIEYTSLEPDGLNVAKNFSRYEPFIEVKLKSPVGTHASRFQIDKLILNGKDIKINLPNDPFYFIIIYYWNKNPILMDFELRTKHHYFVSKSADEWIPLTNGSGHINHGQLSDPELKKRLKYIIMKTFNAYFLDIENTDSYDYSGEEVSVIPEEPTSDDVGTMIKFKHYVDKGVFKLGACLINGVIMNVVPIGLDLEYMTVHYSTAISIMIRFAVVENGKKRDIYVLRDRLLHWRIGTKPVKTPEDSTSRDNTPKDNTSRDNTPKDNTSRDNTPKDNTSSDKTPKDNTSRDNTPKDNTSSDKTPEDSTSRDNTPKDNTSRDNTPKDNTSRDNTPKDNTSRDNTPKDNTSSDKTPKDNTSRDKTPKDNTSRDNTPKDNTSRDNTPKDNTSRDNTPKDNTSRDNTPKDNTSRDNTPKDNTSSDKTPKDNTSRDKTPKDNTSRDKTPKDNTSRDNTPKDNTSRDNTPKDNTSRDNTPKDNTSSDKTPKDNTSKKSDDSTPLFDESKNVIIKLDVGKKHDYDCITNSASSKCKISVKYNDKYSPCTMYIQKPVLSNPSDKSKLSLMYSAMTSNGTKLYGIVPGMISEMIVYFLDDIVPVGIQIVSDETIFYINEGKNFWKNHNESLARFWFRLAVLSIYSRVNNSVVAFDAGKKVIHVDRGQPPSLNRKDFGVYKEYAIQLADMSKFIFQGLTFKGLKYNFDNGFLFKNKFVQMKVYYDNYDKVPLMFELSGEEAFRFYNQFDGTWKNIFHLFDDITPHLDRTYGKVVGAISIDNYRDYNNGSIDITVISRKISDKYVKVVHAPTTNNKFNQVLYRAYFIKASFKIPDFTSVTAYFKTGTHLVLLIQFHVGTTTIDCSYDTSDSWNLIKVSSDITQTLDAIHSKFYPAGS